MAPNRLSSLTHFSSSPFGQLTDEARAALDDAARYRVLVPSEFIYLQDDPADFLYFVRSGHIRLSYLLEDGSPILFGILSAGQSFGELGVFEEGFHQEMSTAIGTSSIYAIPAPVFRAIAGRYSELNIALGRVVAQRYRSYISLTRILGLKSLQARISQCLLRIADGLDERVSLEAGHEILRVGPFVTQADLGLMARGARGNVNRALKAWESDGIIEMRERSILIRDRARLEAVTLYDDA